jgi:N-[(2S)-2-amino-2-carboxyethyl]-L-glutamate dehydrogenase
MLYLGSGEIVKMGIQWNELTEVIKNSTELIRQKDFAQPMKPYLRYRNPLNRIIAMPAFVGGNISMAGIKWIASFPSNLNRGLSRAHSVTILNNADTGIPLSVINTTLISAIRTAAVSGFFIKEMVTRKELGSKINVGLTGLGIIGRMHLDMLYELFGSSIASMSIYDIRAVSTESIPVYPGISVHTVDSWQKAYENADIFITCTVSKDRYIDVAPKKGSIQLNVSLRDYKPELLRFMNHVVVDDWDEICREDTDIERMHLEFGLQKSGSLSLAEMVGDGLLSLVDKQDTIMFNPMGMAVYDVAIASYYYNKALSKNIGIVLQ